MTGAHVAGGGVGAVVGAVIAEALRRYVGWEVSDVDAALIGSAALSVGVGLGHLVSSEGIVPAIRRAFFGPPKTVLLVPASGGIEPALDRVTEPANADPEPDQQEPASNGGAQS